MKKVLIGIVVVYSLSIWSEPPYQVGPYFDSITDFGSDRLAFHYNNQVDVSGKTSKNASVFRDNSESTLMIIKDGETYIIRDGYDDPYEVQKRKNEYWEKVRLFRERTLMVQEFESVDLLRSKREAQPANFGKSLEEYETELFNLLLKYDSELRANNNMLKKRQAEEENKIRTYGPSSFQYREAKVKTEEASKKLKERFEYVKAAIRNKEKADAKEKLPEVVYPGPEHEQEFYKNNTDGTADYIAYARTKGSPDFIKIDKSGSNVVQTNYNKLFTEVRDKLIVAHLEKYKYFLTNMNTSNSTILIEDIPIDNSLKDSATEKDSPAKPSAETPATTPAVTPAKSQDPVPATKESTKPADSKGSLIPPKGKKLTLTGGDSTRYIFVDADGDGQVESFFVFNNDIKFRWAKETPNIISIQNCKEPVILNQIKDMITKSISGDFGSLDGSKFPKTGVYVPVPEEEVVAEVSSYLKKN